MTPLLDPAALLGPSATRLATPFALVVAPGVLADDRADALRADFPAYRGAGYFPYEAGDCGPTLQALVEALHGRPFAEAVGAALGIPDLHQRPVLVELCRSLNRRHGNVHTDSVSKVATALIYLNAGWDPAQGGSLRLLADPADPDSLLVPEVPPLYGRLVAFRRSDRSWHGHAPCEGERLAIQIAWLVDGQALDRKRSRGRFSRLLKRVIGGLDRHWRAR